MGTARKTLHADNQEALRGLVERQGQVATAAAFGISPQTLAALTAGFRVHPAIVEMVERKLAELGARTDPVAPSDEHEKGGPTR